MQLQTPTEYGSSGLYERWDNYDVDGDNLVGASTDADDDAWDFGLVNQHPVLKFGGLDTTLQFNQQPDQAPSFAAAAPSDVTVQNGRAITPIQVPAAGAGNGAVTIAASGLPAGRCHCVYTRGMDASQPRAQLGTHRDAPPHFAGRTVELAALNRRIDAVCESGQGEAGMSLITGVQGVGKTHLGLKFARDVTWREGPRRVFWKSLLPDTLAAEEAIVFLAIMRALGCESLGRKIADVDAKTTAVGGGIGLAKANIAVDRVRKAHDLGELLSESVAAGAWEGKALVVTIDELQTVSAAGMGALRVLHQGVPDCPLMVLGMGLQHTPEVLSSPTGAAGISRVAEEFRLGPLSHAETYEAVHDGLLALGHEIPAACAERLAKGALGFPQHIHGYLAGACEAIARHGGLHDGAPLAEALASGKAAKVAYYEGRLRLLANSRAMLTIVDEMVARDTDALDIDATTAALDAASFDGDAVVREAIQHGVLTRNARSELSFGIPSFHAYMKDWLRHEQQRAKENHSG